MFYLLYINRWAWRLLQVCCFAEFITYFSHVFLTISLHPNPPWETKIYSAGQLFPRLLWIPLPYCIWAAHSADGSRTQPPQRTVLVLHYRKGPLNIQWEVPYGGLKNVHIDTVWPLMPSVNHWCHLSTTECPTGETVHIISRSFDGDHHNYTYESNQQDAVV